MLHPISARLVIRKTSAAATSDFKEDKETLGGFSSNVIWDSGSSSKASSFQKVHHVKWARSKLTLLGVFVVLSFFITSLGIRKYVKP